MSILQVKGKTVDSETHCSHYHTASDVIAIKFKCCGTYYSCYYCHEEESGHQAQVWQKNEFDLKTILCGVCKVEMSITKYRSSNYYCPFCKTPFNPKCSNHDHLYFEL